jgi:hypothetical protein
MRTFRLTSPSVRGAGHECVPDIKVTAASGVTRTAAAWVSPSGGRECCGGPW